MKFLKYGIVALFLILTTATVIALIWAWIPIQTNQQAIDPATHHLNALSPSAPPLEDAYFEHDGLNLHYVVGGEGEIVVLVHGFPSYWYSFSRQADALRSDHRVIALDGLGVGLSDAPGSVDAYRLENMTEHLLALIDHLGADKVHLVGHDWGSALVLGFTQKYPSRVATVTGISSPPQNIMLQLLTSNPDQQQTSQYIERLKSANSIALLALQVPSKIWDGAYRPHVEKGRLSKEEGELFRNAISSPKRINAHINWYRANIPAYQKITPADFWPNKDARITVPTLLVWGNDDTVFVPEFIDRMQQSSDALTVLRFDNVGHSPHLERPLEVTTAIQQHISTHSALAP